MPMATFIRDYATVLDEVEANDEAVVLERRAGRPSFVLAPLRRAEGDRHAVAAVAHVLRAALRGGARDLPETIARGLADEHPWVVFLPRRERDAFERELLETLRACATIGRFTAFENLLDSWQATAEIYSDPALARRLTAVVDVPHGGEVSAPPAV
jgi:hypothetical protein